MPNIPIIVVVAITLLSFIEAGAVTRSTSDGEDLGLMMLGAIVNTNHNDNVALIKERKSQRTLAVKIGYKILDKYTVGDIQLKFLLLRSNRGDIHLVYQNIFSQEFKARTKIIASAPSPDSDYSEEGFERKNGNVAMTQAYRDKIVDQDLSKILMQATAVPYYEDGILKGFRLLQIDRGSIFENGGFVDDDVITSINGTPLTTIPGTIKLLQSLKKESNIQVEYLRGSSFKNLNISVN